MNLMEFETKQGDNCVLGNLYNTLKYYHTDIEEYHLFFWCSAFLGDRKLNQVFHMFYDMNSEESWIDYAEKKIGEGKPVLINIDPKILSYIHLSVGDTSRKHFVNLIGIDKEKAQVLVSDSYIPTFKPSVHKGWVKYENWSADDIENSWAINEEVLSFFQNEITAKELRLITLYWAVKRVEEFLEKGNGILTGEEILKKRKMTFVDCISANRYDEVFTHLAGMRINIMNPLKYLAELLGTDEADCREFEGRVRELFKDGWEKLNARLVKYALAHKKLDVEGVYQEFDRLIDWEINLLKDFVAVFREKAALAESVPIMKRFESFLF